MKITDEPVIVEQNYDVSLAELWKAITELNQMKKWFFENIEAFEPKVGFRTRFIIENEGREFPHLWTITEVEPLKKIAYNWKYEGYKGDSIVSFLLSEKKDLSKLTLIHQVTEKFSENIVEFQRESCLNGWNWFIKSSLKDYLKSIKQ
jgi:uncharacterized protein YndB with AHSA1/START domain